MFYILIGQNSYRLLLEDNFWDCSVGHLLTPITLKENVKFKKLKGLAIIIVMFISEIQEIFII